jgi:dihydroorotase
MLEKVKEGYITIERMVEKMAHAPATLFRIENRGFLREGYAADIVLVNPSAPTKVMNEEVLYKCAWTPFHDYTFSSAISKTFVNGNLVYNNGKIQEQGSGQRLTFRV